MTGSDAAERSIIVVDTEADGLDPDRHEPVEVAWLRFRGYGAGSFIPPHSLAFSDPESLRINRYEERLRGKPWDDRFSAAEALHISLRGNVLAGFNPAFDAAMLGVLFRRAGLPVQPWHYRLLDLSAYGAGVLGLDPAHLPGADALARRLDVEVPEQERHTAMGDCQLAVAVLGRLLEITAGRSELRQAAAVQEGRA